MRTKKAIFSAFYLLLQEKSFESITIKNILEEAEISRSTFYRYFNDKYEIPCWYYDSCVKQIMEDHQADLNMDIELAIIQVITSDPVFFRKIFNIEGQNSFENFIAEYTYRFFLTTIQQQGKEALIENEKFALKIYCDGAGSAMNQWLNSKFIYDDETLVRYFKEAKPAFLKEVMNT